MTTDGNNFVNVDFLCQITQHFFMLSLDSSMKSSQTEGNMRGKFLLGLLLSSGVSIGANAGEFLVKYKPHAYVSMMSFYGMSVEDSHKDINLFKVSIPKKLETKVIVDLFQSGSIDYIVPNAKVHAYRAPLTASALKDQWHIAKINAEQAWQKAGNRGSHKVTVAVIDTGVDYNHPSLKGNMVEGYDYHQNDADPMDIVGTQNPGHGTHCAGIMGANGLEEGGTIGISPELSIMPIRFLGEDGSGDLNNAIKAIDLAISKKVDIISASWGAAIPRDQATPLLEAIQRAEAAGLIFVAAAANDGKNNDVTSEMPANAGFSNVISVAASDAQDAKPSWSNYGKSSVHVASPGNAIMSTLPGGKYDNLSGTSMATPLVAGLIGFLKAQDPTLTPQQVRAILQTTGVKANITTQCNCRIDALAATTLVVDKKMYVVPAAGTYATDAKIKFEAPNAQGAVQWASSDANIMKIEANGEAQALKDGEVTITATDAQGIKAQTLTMFVGKPQGSEPGNPGNPGEPGNPGMPGNPGDCPFEDEQTCQALCQIMPDMPFCKK